ncbi:MAG: AbiH family protein [Candidatus Cryptobacteroides sp.]
MINNSIEEIAGLFSGEDSETLLIIGNGFDLDLGLKTGYKDYVNSDKWPFKHCSILSPRLGSYLRRKTLVHWYDVESVMEQYCSRTSRANKLRMNWKPFVNKVREDDEKLRNGLVEYLIEAENGELNKESIAATILKKCCESIEPATIYSFNYTDLESIAKRLNIELNYSPKYVHGTLKNKDIVLGFSETKDIVPELSFMCKSHRDTYSHTPLIRDISKFSNIIFFGLSFGEIDYGYFKDFFDGVCDGRYDNKFIRIVTKDEESRQSILNNIGKMTGKIFDIRKHANFKVIRTEDESDLSDFDLLYRVIDVQDTIDPDMLYLI